MTFRNKIFLFLATFITLSIVLIILLLNSQIKSNMKTTLEMDLERIHDILTEYQQSRSELLKLKSNFLAEEPRLKAAIETGDRETVTREVQKFLPIVETDFFIVTDHRAAILANVGQDVPAPVSVPSIEAALSFQQTTQLFVFESQAVYIISTPVTIMNQFGRNILLGTISIGQRIDAQYLEQIKKLTGCDVGFVIQESRAGKSGLLRQFSFQRESLNFDGSAVDSLFNHLGARKDVQQIELAGNVYIAQSLSLIKEEKNHGLLLLRSLDDTLLPILRPIQNSLVVIGFLSLLLALLFSYFLSSNITSPVSKLVGAAQRIGKGNLETPVRFSGKDEIGILADQFEQMRLSLKKNLDELEKTYARLVQSEKLATTGKLLAQLSHEINNPIHNIQSALEASRKKCSEENPAKKLIDVAYDEILRLAKLVRQTLDFYRPGSLERIPLNVNDVLNELVVVSERNFSKSRITILPELAEDLNEIRANKDQLKQVFLNMMLNAKEAMPSGGSLTIKSQNLEKKVRIEFIDTGTGISGENIQKIFDAFFTTKSQVSGVGLGLSVSYEIIRQHNGEISVESELNKGTRFIIQFPFD